MVEAKHLGPDYAKAFHLATTRRMTTNTDFKTCNSCFQWYKALHLDTVYMHMQVSISTVVWL